MTIKIFQSYKSKILVNTLSITCTNLSAILCFLLVSPLFSSFSQPVFVGPIIISEREDGVDEVHDRVLVVEGDSLVFSASSSELSILRTIS